MMRYMYYYTVPGPTSQKAKKLKKFQSSTAGNWWTIVYKVDQVHIVGWPGRASYVGKGSKTQLGPDHLQGLCSPTIADVYKTMV